MPAAIRTGNTPALDCIDGVMRGLGFFPRSLPIVPSSPIGAGSVVAQVATAAVCGAIRPNGKVRTTLVPLPSVLSIENFPPWSSVILAAKGSPSPLP